MPAPDRPIRLVALCGSLRAASVHRALLEASVALLPAFTTLEIFSGLADLPAFSPDLDFSETEPAPVRAFRAFLRDSDALLVASPEYAHGIPGALKNALDWVVASGELSGRPVAVLNLSHSSFHAWAALQEVIKTMDARLIEEACVRLPLPHNRLTAEEIVALPAVTLPLAAALSVLASAARSAYSPVQP